jgi:uncharacterized membrane protein YwaF
VNGIFSFTYDHPFVLFSPSHLATLAVVLAVWVSVPLLLRGVLREERGRSIARWILAGVMLLTRRKTWTYVHHGLLILAVLYMTIVERFRPTFRSFLKVAVITNGYLVVIFFFNVLVRSNYVFINRVPDFDTLVNVLVQVTGPWPWYVLGMEIVGAVTCLLVYAPFAVQDAVTNIRGRRVPIASSTGRA